MYTIDDFCARKQRALGCATLLGVAGVTKGKQNKTKHTDKQTNKKNSKNEYASCTDVGLMFSAISARHEAFPRNHVHLSYSTYTTSLEERGNNASLFLTRMTLPPRNKTLNAILRTIEREIESANTSPLIGRWYKGFKKNVEAQKKRSCGGRVKQYRKKKHHQL